MSSRVCVAQIIGAHGVHGRVRLKSFTADPEAVFTYAPLTDEAGTRVFKVKMTGMGKDHFLATVEGLKDKTQADALKGTRLFVDRSALPEPEDEEEFYHADLLGLPTATVAGQDFGTIKAIHDFGAGDMLEILHVSGKTVFIPFTKAVVPVVDVRTPRILVDPPVNLFTPAKPDPEELAEMGGRLDDLSDPEPAAEAADGEGEAAAMDGDRERGEG